ncbi:MAG: IS1595 family transposase [Acidobacteria bacterium]|nr:MAG: IS1595 family transposase [Acidobacteriota bacterium]
MIASPKAGLHYPVSTGEFLAWFRTDADCLDYIEWLRWPEGFTCPGCAGVTGWRLADGRIWCRSCDRRTSATAGTIFDRTRTPLTVWFAICWQFATQKDGVSALSIHQTLEISSYQTAWAMLHRLRSTLVRPGRERLTGTVEVDETYIGGEEPGLPGGRAKGKKSLVAIAVERRGPKRLGRCRMAMVPDATGESLSAFVRDHVEEGSTVITDGWMGYRPIARLGTSTTIGARMPLKRLIGFQRGVTVASRSQLGLPA